MLRWLAMRLASLREWVDNNEAWVMRVGTRSLAAVCLLVAVVYAVIFFMQVSAM